MSYDLPDHYVIQNLERTGYPNGKEPTHPHCPVCGAECDTIYWDKSGEIFGCDECVEANEAWETNECFPEKEDE